MANVFEAIERAMHGAVDAACAAAANDNEGLAGNPERPGPDERAGPAPEMAQAHQFGAATAAP